MNNISQIWYITHWELLLRMGLAAGLGGLVGMEREWSNHAAGFRTHILVCLGSATIMLLSIYGFTEFVNEPNVRIDPARLAAQVISGVGFLGAGAILRNGQNIKGLTSAASIWVVAAIGLCVGAGFMYAAVYATFMVLFSLFLLNKWEKHMLRNRRSSDVSIKAMNSPGVLGTIASKFGEHGIQIINVKMIPDIVSDEADKRPEIQLIFSLKMQDQAKLLLVLDQLNSYDFILYIESGRNSMNQENQQVARA
ncbi:MgtC/SapB family protein [Paenibacillus nasutitermitis]